MPIGMGIFCYHIFSLTGNTGKGVIMSEKRNGFSGKIGFILAAAGSAVGLGNIWRFPYLAAKYGGGIFLLVYLLLALTFGFSLLIAEFALGRKTGKSVIGAFAALNPKYRFIGWLGALIPAIVLPYYAVIGGWVLKYFGVFMSAKGSLAANDGFFETFISRPVEPVFWFLLFFGITALIVLSGVDKGIEKISKIAMPVLIVLTMFLTVYTLFIPGAMAGVRYYLSPDFSAFSVNTVLAAMGQLFYSMSIAMGVMITYGSYLKKDVDLESSVKQIEWFDTGIAFLSGLMIIPAVFAFSGGDTGALQQGQGMMFVTLPKVFQSFEGGTFIGAIFFLLVFFAAVTSSVAMMEAVVASVKDQWGWTRKTAVTIVTVVTILIGIFISMGYGNLSRWTIGDMHILDFFDFISNSVLMPIMALLTCLFVGYVISPKLLAEEIGLSGRFKRQKMFAFIIRYVAPAFIFIILLSSVLDMLGIWKL